MDAHTVKELREMAKAKKIKGYSKMKKAELISSLGKLKNGNGISKKLVVKGKKMSTKKVVKFAKTEKTKKAKSTSWKSWPRDKLEALAETKKGYSSLLSTKKELIWFLESDPDKTAAELVEKLGPKEQLIIRKLVSNKYFGNMYPFTGEEWDPYSKEFYEDFY